MNESPRYINPYGLFIGSFVPNWLMRQAYVSPGAKLCYAVLCQHAGADGRCFPRQSTLADELATSIRQVRRYLDELIKHQLIEEVQHGLNTPNDYLFLHHEWMQEFRNDRNPLPIKGHSGEDINVRSGQDISVRSGRDKNVRSGQDTSVRSKADTSVRSIQREEKNQRKESTTNPAVALLAAHGIKNPTLENLAKNYPLDQIKAAITRFQIEQLRTTLKNPQGWLVRCIEEGFDTAVQSANDRDRQRDKERRSNLMLTQKNKEYVKDLEIMIDKMDDLVFFELAKEVIRSSEGDSKEHYLRNPTKTNFLLCEKVFTAARTR